MDTLVHVGLSNALLATFLALVTAGLCAVWRRPALAHGLWLLVLLKLVTPPLVPLSVPRIPGAESDVIDSLFTSRQARSSIAAAEPVPVETDWLAEASPEELAALAELPFEDLTAAAIPERKTVASVPERRLSDWLKPALLAIWLIGSGSWLALVVVRIARFQRLLRHGRLAPASLQGEARDIAGRLGLSGCPRVYLVPGAVSPMLWVLAGAPKLLLPAELLSRLDRNQRATLLAHELAHLHRHDHWVRTLEIVATSLYWWHPVVWWARRELREAEEQCCDAWVVWALPQSARAYATALLETVDFLSEVRPALPPVASGIGQVTLLKRRLTMIMQAQTPRTLSRVGFLALLGLGTVLLPAWVQAEPPATEQEQLSRELRDLAERVGKGEIEVNVQMQLERLQDLLDDAKKEVGNKKELLGILSNKLGDNPILTDLNKRLADMKIELAIVNTEVGADHPEIKNRLRKIEALKGALHDQAKNQIQFLLTQADGKRPSMDEIERALRRNLRDASDEDINKILRQIKEVRGKEDKKGGKDGKEPSKEEMERARAEVKKAQEEMKRASEQMRAAARRMADAQRKLAQLGGRGRGSFNIDFDTKDGKKVLKIERKEEKTSTGPTPKKAPKVEVFVKPTPPRPPAAGRGSGSGGSGDREDRMRDLEKRLGDLLDEVKRMRTEMRQQPREPRQPRAPRPPADQPPDAS